MCRPDISKRLRTRLPHTCLKGVWNPLTHADTVVPSDIILGRHGDVDKATTCIITGPNMGGKSTFLRAGFSPLDF